MLEAILETTISPELVPATAEGIQPTEKLIGPCVLRDFFLFHHVRNGFRPRKVFAPASLAFGREYGEAEIKKRLRAFFDRFYRRQFKRTCLPPGPKAGSVSLHQSPRAPTPRGPEGATSSPPAPPP